MVRVSYEYPEFQQPDVSDAQAMKIALGRCTGWGYDDAEPIAGQIRQCSNMEGAQLRPVDGHARVPVHQRGGAFASNSRA